PLAAEHGAHIGRGLLEEMRARLAVEDGGELGEGVEVQRVELLRALERLLRPAGVADLEPQARGAMLVLGAGRGAVVAFGETLELLRGARGRAGVEVKIDEAAARADVLGAHGEDDAQRVDRPRSVAERLEDVRQAILA